MNFRNIALIRSVVICALMVVVISSTTVMRSAIAQPNLSEIYAQVTALPPDAQRMRMVNNLGEGSGKVAYLDKDNLGQNYVLKVCKEADGCANLLQRDTTDNNLIKGHFSNLFVDYYPTDPNSFQTAPLFPCADNKMDVGCRITVETFVSRKHFDISSDFYAAVQEDKGVKACLWNPDEQEEVFENYLLSRMEPVIVSDGYNDELSTANGQSFATMSTLLGTWNYIFEDLQGGFLDGKSGFVAYDTGADNEFGQDAKNCQINWICALSMLIADYETVETPCTYVQQ